MREIKFRAWDTLLKRTNLVNELKFWRGDITVHTEHGGGISRFKLLQFTGLKDKNGKEIYEGDIVQWICNNGFPKGDKRFGEVEFNGGCFIVGHYGYLGDILMGMGLDTIRKGSFKVIGNIYENPELLKDAKEVDGEDLI